MKRFAAVVVALGLVVPGVIGVVPAAAPAAPVSPDVEVAPDVEEIEEVDPVDPIRTAEWWLSQYEITKAWQVTRGAGVRVAVLDTGIARGLSSMQDAVVGGTDVSGIGSPDGRTPVGVVDADHGTLVGSLLGARGTGPDTGFVGAAPEAELLSVSVGFGSAAAVPFTQQVADAIYWAVDNGADIINMSWTTNVSEWDESWDEAFLYAAEHDVLMVVAAGNRASGTERVGAPATIPGVLTVGGVDPDGRASQGSSTQGITIAVSGPSERLLGLVPDGGLVWWDGTSAAAPVVAGIAALVRSAHPELDVANVINRIIRTATPPPGGAEVPDALYGYGIVDAYAAVTASVPHVDANPMGDLAEWIRVYRRAAAEPAPPTDDEAVVLAPLPEAEPPTRAVSPLLPTRATLLYGSLPLAGATLAAILVALGVTVGALRVRSARPPGTQRPRHEETTP